MRFSIFEFRFSNLPERYRSGHNGGASKASCLPKAGTWVRIPPSPPNNLFNVNGLQLILETCVCFVCFLASWSEVESFFATQRRSSCKRWKMAWPTTSERDDSSLSQWRWWKPPRVRHWFTTVRRGFGVLPDRVASHVRRTSASSCSWRALTHGA